MCIGVLCQVWQLGAADRMMPMWVSGAAHGFHAREHIHPMLDA